MTPTRRNRTRNDYERAVAARLAAQNFTLEPEVFQSIWLLHESAAISRRTLAIPALHDRRFTWTQFEVLLHLWLFGPARMGDVAAAAVISNPTLTDVVVGYSRNADISPERRAASTAARPCWPSRPRGPRSSPPSCPRSTTPTPRRGIPGS